MTKKVDGLYLCEECGLLYLKKVWAERCEDWCSVHKSCSLEITKHAVDKSYVRI
jgi:hypothetical protein